ncbi:DUF6318 family protein [Kineosporia corallincola]|uniref:DUF6318 family protein n=1 Tax=Kineosporia corallincola TaxID=2835133 RepID=UPI0035570648
MIGGFFRGVVVVSGLLALTACWGGSSGATSATTATVSASATGSPTATLAPPVAPEAERSAEGAEAFVRYFWEVHNYAYENLETKLLTRISEPKCSFCRATDKNISELRTEGTQIQGSRVRMDQIAVPPIDIKTGVIVSGTIDQEPAQLTHANGSQTTASAISNAQCFVSLNWTQNSWLVADVAIEES